MFFVVLLVLTSDGNGSIIKFLRIFWLKVAVNVSSVHGIIASRLFGGVLFHSLFNRSVELIISWHFRILDGTFICHFKLQWNYNSIYSVMFFQFEKKCIIWSNVLHLFHLTSIWYEFSNKRLLDGCVLLEMHKTTHVITF